MVTLEWHLRKFNKMLLTAILINSYSSFTNTAPKEKFVIGQHGAGFFSNFFGALNQLDWCEKNNKIPVIYWDNKSHYYNPSGFNDATNVWEYYFEPVSNLTYEPGEPIHKNYGPPTGQGLGSFSSLLKNKHRGKNLIDRHIRIRAETTAKIEQFYQTHMAGKKTIGIHIRGTDKYKEIKRVSAEKIIDAANQFHGYQYLVATDEQKSLKKAQKYLNGKVIFYNCQRSYDGQPLHLGQNYKNNAAQLGEDILVEAQLLSRCDIFIHTNSNVAFGVLYFNPNLKHIFLGSKM